MRRLIPFLAMATLVTAAGLASRSAVASAPTFSHPLDITNPYKPFVPGAVQVFRGKKDREASVIVDLYLSDTRTFSLGGSSVDARIIQETEFAAGQVVEISKNFSAQADDGTVYYFGEVVDTYTDGVVDGHEGSWLVGGATQPLDPAETINASVPGVFMPATPMVGDAFKPEDLLPFLDETDTVKATNKKVQTPAGRFTNAIQVVETTALGDPPETKWYVPGVGVVKGHTKGEDFSLVATILRPQ